MHHRDRYTYAPDQRRIGLLVAGMFMLGVATGIAAGAVLVGITAPHDLFHPLPCSSPTSATAAGSRAPDDLADSIEAGACILNHRSA